MIECYDSEDSKPFGIRQQLFAKSFGMLYIRHMTHDQILKKFKTPSNAARSIGVTLQTLRNWKERGIPHKSQVWIEFQLGGALKAAKK